MQDVLDQPGLTSERVAALLSVSVRSLRRAFAAGSTSFALSLRQLRLERAAQLLAQPRPVAELGRRCG